jgi:signal transduction histidine kinase
MMRRLNFLLLIILTGAAMSAQERPVGVSPSVGRVLELATDYMGRSAYDSAAQFLNEAFAQTEVSYSNIDLYYLLAYEAENMYYNALFDQGLNSAYRSLEVAKAMGNDTLTGNSENIVGLMLMSLNQDDEALQHFRRASSLLPRHQIDYLSYRYQVLSNAAECFLKKEMPDSAFVYAQSGLEEARVLGKIRGEAIIGWTLAEAWLKKKEYNQALNELQHALQLVEQSQHRDLVLTMYTTFMMIYEASNKRKELFDWMDRGLAELKNPMNTDYARSVFLETATDMCIAMNELEKGSELMRSWKQLQKNLIEKQQGQRLTILKDYYEKNQRLVLAKEQDLAQQGQISLRNTIAIILGLLSVVLVILIAIVLVYFRQRQRIAKLEYKEQMRRNEIEFELRSLETRMAAISAERDRIASDLHDDIGASLSSIRIYSGAAHKRFTDKPDEALRLIDLINEGSSGMMDRMSDIVWSINPKNDNVESIVFRMKSHAGEMLSPLNVEVDYRMDKEAEQIQPSMTARRNIYLIFKEAINNIAKYSKATHVDVELQVHQGTFVLEIADNGIGFDSGNHKAGNGLTTMQRRASSLGGVLTITSAPGGGTRLSIELQIARISDVPIR